MSIMKKLVYYIRPSGCTSFLDDAEVRFGINKNELYEIVLSDDLDIMFKVRWQAMPFFVEDIQFLSGLLMSIKFDDEEMFFAENRKGLLAFVSGKAPTYKASAGGGESTSPKEQAGKPISSGFVHIDKLSDLYDRLDQAYNSFKGYQVLYKRNDELSKVIINDDQESLILIVQKKYWRENINEINIWAREESYSKYELGEE